MIALWVHRGFLTLASIQYRSLHLTYSCRSSIVLQSFRIILLDLLGEEIICVRVVLRGGPPPIPAPAVVHGTWMLLQPHQAVLPTFPVYVQLIDQIVRINGHTLV